uniref:Thymocyte nuclear protein 1 n=1 Tax=Monodelphis domestica TaxID=13616 RepID=A0A5F8GSE8_MONDO
MPRQRKRACQDTPEPETEAPAGKLVKANKAEIPAEPLGEAKTSDSPEKNRATKESGNETSRYWLMKSEPESRLEKGIDVKFGIEDLKAQPRQTACWDGVRNYQARNFLRTMKLGEKAFFYHSNCKEPGIAGLVKIVKEAYPDHTQFEKDSPHYDPSSKKDNPKWSMENLILS